jgi:hypothetical protein
MAGGTRITNTGPGTASLPFPLTGTLTPGQSIAVSYARSVILGAVGTPVVRGAQLKYTALAPQYTGPYGDASYLGQLNSDGTVSGLKPLASPTLYVSATGSDTAGTGSAANPYATVQHALGVLAVSGWTGAAGAVIQMVNTLPQGANPLPWNIPPAPGGAGPVTIQSAYTDSGLGPRTATSGTAPVFSGGPGVGPSLGTVVDNVGGLTASAWQGYYLRWTSGANAGRRASIQDNNATTFFLARGTFSATAPGDTFVVEKPAAQVTFSGRMRVQGAALVTAAFDFVGTVSGFSGSVLDVSVDTYMDNGVRYIAPGGGGVTGMYVLMNCRYYESGLYTLAFPIYTPFGALAALDGTPSQFLGGSSDTLYLYIGASGSWSGANGSAVMWAPNFLYTNVQVLGGCNVVCHGPYAFIGQGVETSAGGQFTGYYQIARNNVNIGGPAGGGGCFLANGGGSLTYLYQGTFGGQSGTVDLMQSFEGGTVHTELTYNEVANAPTTTGAAMRGVVGGVIEPVNSSDFCTASAVGTLGGPFITDGSPGLGYSDEQAAQLPQRLPSTMNPIVGSGTTTTNAAVTIASVNNGGSAPTGTQRVTYIDVVFAGYSSSGSKAYTTKLRVAVTNKTGGYAIVGSVVSNVADETFNDASLAGCTFGVVISSANTILLQATGIAATTIDWVCQGFWYWGSTH